MQLYLQQAQVDNLLWSVKGLCEDPRFALACGYRVGILYNCTFKVTSTECTANETLGA